MATTNAVNTLGTSASLGKSSLSKADEAGSQDRFLKLLVTQLKNQDPLSPMDNAQLTSQIAQINTVTGIEKLNTSVQGLSGQFLQMQTLQGAALVGKDVIVAGNKLDFEAGVGQGGFELTAAADAVKVEVLSPAGQVIETLNLGAQNVGRHSFNWPSGSTNANVISNNSNLSFRVTATSGATVLNTTALMRDKVDAVSTAGDTLMLELQRSGSVAYGSVKALN